MDQLDLRQYIPTYLLPETQSEFQMGVDYRREDKGAVLNLQEHKWLTVLLIINNQVKSSDSQQTDPDKAESDPFYRSNVKIYGTCSEAGSVSPQENNGYKRARNLIWATIQLEYPGARLNLH